MPGDNENDSSSDGGPPLAVEKEIAGVGGRKCSDGARRGGMNAEVVAMLLPHVPLVSRLLGQQVNCGGNSN